MNERDFRIKKGDCILTEEPFVFVLKSKYRMDRCENCLEPTKVFKCANCQYVYYCGKKCQKDSWSLHKFECPMLKRIYPRTVPDAARILCKLILRLNHGGDLVRGYYTKTEWRRFRDLMSHYAEIKNDTKRMEHLESLYQILSEMMESLTSIPNNVELLSIYGRLVTNGFNILDAEMNSIATAIYLGVSVTDHSCSPNAVATFEGTTLKIHAIENIENLDWSKIFISYVDLLNTTDDRRLNLRENYYFHCVCSRCIDYEGEKETEAAACPNKMCAQMIRIENEECPCCQTPISATYRQDFNEVMEFTKNKLDEMRDVAYLDVCKICLARQRNLLHALNLWHVKTLDLAFEAAIEIEKWQEAVHYGLELLPGFQKYYGSANPLVGILYLKIGKIQLLENYSAEAKHYLEKALEILEITHGPYHSVIKSQLAPLLLQATLESNIKKK